MPNPKMDSLMKDSTHMQVNDAISSEIEMCMNSPAPEGVSDADKQKYCAGKAYGMARQSTGQSLDRGK